MRNLLMTAWAACGLLALAMPASRAQMASTGGEVAIVAPPANVSEGANESNRIINAFAEQQGVTLTHALSADITEPGLYFFPPIFTPLTPGTVAAGTTVDSYYLYSDPKGHPLLGRLFSGSITFDQDILGVIVLNTRQSHTLDDSDFLGLSNTAYPTGLRPRGLDLLDAFYLSPDRRTLSLAFDTFDEVDSVRVITASAAVPEPAQTAALGLGFLGLGGLMLVARKRRPQAV